MSSTSERRRLPLSVPNIVIVAVGIAGTVVCAVTGNPAGAIFLGLITALGLSFALWARRPAASDLSRINAIEYRDERDKQLATYGFAVVGAVALGLAIVESVTAIILAGAVFDRLVGSTVITVACLNQIVFFGVWGFANVRAVRRG